MNKNTVSSAVACRKFVNQYPHIKPHIVLLTPNTAVLGTYVEVQISGVNFSRSGPTGFSTVNFGSIKNIPTNFYSSLNISFVVPVIGVTAGTYDIQVVNNIYPTSLYSNKVPFTLTL